MSPYRGDGILLVARDNHLALTTMDIDEETSHEYEVEKKKIHRDAQTRVTEAYEQRDVAQYYYAKQTLEECITI